MDFKMQKLQLLVDSTIENVGDLEFGNDILHTTLKAQSKKNSLLVIIRLLRVSVFS